VSASSPVGDGADAARMGVTAGTLVMEIGFDSDADEALRASLAAASGEELLDEDSDEVVDVVLLWHRDDDGDLADALVDAVSPLADDGVIWLLTPRRGRPSYVEPSDVSEAADIAGLSRTSMLTVGQDWTAARLVGRKSGTRR
jgi:hypothetical protein